MKDFFADHNLTVHMSTMRVLRVRSNGLIPLPDASDLRHDREMKMNLHDNDTDLHNCIDYSHSKYLLMTFEYEKHTLS